LQNTYTTQVGNVANSNPITLNVRGETPNEVWLTGGLTYKLILKDATGSTVWTVDNISGINDPAASVQDEWKASGLVPTYVSATSFTFPGDQTVAFHAGRRVKTTNSGGTVYSSIETSTYAPNVTTITVRNDSGSLDSGLSAVSYGLIAYNNTSLPAARATGTGAISRLMQDKARDLVSVTDFGAKCDGATDDSTAIQNAFSASARSINFPDGTCLYSTPLTVTTAKRIVGTPNTILRWTGNTASGTIQVGFQGTNLERVELRQLQIEKTVAATATTLLHVRGVQHSVFDSLTFGSTTIGAGTGATTDNILTEKTWVNTWNNIRSQFAGRYGMYLKAQTAYNVDASNDNIITNYNAESNTTAGIAIQDSEHNVIYGGTFEDFLAAGQHGVLLLGRAGRTVVRDSYFESQTAAANDIRVTGAIDNSVFLASGNVHRGGPTVDIYLDRASNALVFGSSSVTVGTHIQITANSDRVFVGPNEIAGSAVTYVNNAGTNTTIYGTKGGDVDWTRAALANAAVLQGRDTGAVLRQLLQITAGNAVVFGDMNNPTFVNGSSLNYNATTHAFAAVVFANLGGPANGNFVYCSDCTIANPCAGGGTGAFAKRLNGVWVCN
jgi:parallel beta-helix repeat protein